jgi:2-polyprenyl-6-methoxyphenol hydroxylase-like FAD-dependent oxidoreductase
MPPSQEKFDVVIIGGGIAGNALATVLARTGRAVLVLERSTVYRDKVRGEVFHAWGVAEAQRLSLYETLMQSGGIHHSRFVPYDETVEPAEAEAAALPLDSVVPGVTGALGVGHPRACEALSLAAIAIGARVLRGVENVEVQLDASPRWGTCWMAPTMWPNVAS